MLRKRSSKKINNAFEKWKKKNNTQQTYHDNEGLIYLTRIWTHCINRRICSKILYFIWTFQIKSFSYFDWSFLKIIKKAHGKYESDIFSKIVWNEYPHSACQYFHEKPINTVTCVPIKTVILETTSRRRKTNKNPS